MTDEDIAEAAGGNEVHRLMLLHMAGISEGQKRLETSFHSFRVEVGSSLNQLAANTKADVTRLHVRIDNHEDKFHKPPSSPRIPTTGSICMRWLGLVSAAGGAGAVLVWALYYLHKMFESGIIK